MAALAADLLLLAVPAGAQAAEVLPLLIQCTTTDNMRLTGSLGAIHRGMLELAGQERDAQSGVGIPIERIRNVQLLTGNLAEASILDLLEPNIDILPLLDDTSLELLVRGVETCLADHDWHSLHRWAVRLESLRPGTDFQRMCTLLKSRALCELGLRSKALEEAAALAAQTDPLDAPAALCDLLAALSSDPDEIQFWSSLPALQIPSRPTDLQPSTCDLNP
jgi:hypothetical protein